MVTYSTRAAGRQAEPLALYKSLHPGAAIWSLVPRPSPSFTNPFTMDETNGAQTREPSKENSDSNMATVAAIEDVESRILHGKQLVLVIAYAGYLISVGRSPHIP